MEQFKVNGGMTFEELVNMIKSLVMFIIQGWDDGNMAEDAKSDFDAIITLGEALNMLESRHSISEHSASFYRKEMLKALDKRDDLEEKLKKINQESSGI